MKTPKITYFLPFKKSSKIKVCDAPYHKTKNSMKNCIDFYMPEGTPILAAREGVVSISIDNYSKNYKNPKYAKKVNLILIKHKDREKSIYVHLKHKSARVKVGENVQRGQAIALSGKTGYATYPHLHFGIYKGKKNLKPRLKNRGSIRFKSYKLFE